MKPISGKHNYSYDELTSAISLIDSSGSKIKQNIPSFEAKNITKNKNISEELVFLLEGCAITSRHMIANGSMLASAIKPSNGVAMVAGPGNETKFDGMYWWGCDLYLNNAFANVIANSLWAGAGVATITAAIASAFGPAGLPVAVTMGVAAGIFGIGAAIFGLANAQGRGVYIRFSYIPPFVWLGSQ